MGRFAGARHERVGQKWLLTKRVKRIEWNNVSSTVDVAIMSAAISRDPSLTHYLMEQRGGERDKTIDNNVSLVVARILVFIKARSLRSLAVVDPGIYHVPLVLNQDRGTAFCDRRVVDWSACLVVALAVVLLQIQGARRGDEQREAKRF